MAGNPSVLDTFALITQIAIWKISIDLLKNETRQQRAVYWCHEWRPDYAVSSVGNGAITAVNRLIWLFWNKNFVEKMTGCIVRHLFVWLRIVIGIIASDAVRVISRPAPLNGGWFRAPTNESQMPKCGSNLSFFSKRTLLKTPSTIPSPHQKLNLSQNNQRFGPIEEEAASGRR